MTTPLLHTTNLNLTRPGGQQVLQDISLQLSMGERVGLIGPNGAGKTSLMLCMTGVTRPTAGDVRMDGVTLAAGGFHPGLGFVFQQAEDQLFSPTVAEDVAFGARNIGLTGSALDKAVATALDRVGITALADRPVHYLSGGEKRLACLAGVLVMEPQALLLDEPSAALDLRNRRRLIDLLHQMDQALLIASHDLELVLELCPRVILIDAGRIVADGPARMILSDAALMARHGQEVPHSLTHAGHVAHSHHRAM